MNEGKGREAAERVGTGGSVDYMLNDEEGGSPVAAPAAAPGKRQKDWLIHDLLMSFSKQFKDKVLSFLTPRRSALSLRGVTAHFFFFFCG